ncbi:MAG: hypothetical protein Q9201_001126 [Fulgogasparrea decipioides]
MRRPATDVPFKIFRSLPVKAPKTLRTCIVSHLWLTQSRRKYATESSLPRVAQPSLWKSITPKFMRKLDEPYYPEKAWRRKEWNPATFFIVMFLLIGSNAMQMLALRNEFTTFSRKADAKIGLLKNVIERVQRGEDVDVKGLLGTGNLEKEKEWEQGQCLHIELPAYCATNVDDQTVIKELEEEDRLWQANVRRRQKKEKSHPSEGDEGKEVLGSKIKPTQQDVKTASTNNKEDQPLTTRKIPRGFY